jgi:glycosyltransferase involved in cell wall biosynthesis
MKRVLFVHSVAEIGGAERMSQVLMEGLDPKLFECLLACPEDGPFLELMRNKGIACHELPATPFDAQHLWRSLKQIWLWAAFLRTQKIDWVHTADPFVTRTILPSIKLAKAKLLTHFHFPFEQNIMRWAYRRMSPDVAVFCSKELQDSTGVHLDSLSLPTEQFVIHNGVDVSRFQPSPATNTEDAEPINIGIVANLQKRKGHDDFIEMAALLKSKGVNAKYWVIGGDILDEPREAHLKQLVTTHHLTEDFVFTGQVDNVIELVDQLHIYVCASHQEAFPVSILEAMALQKVIVSTDVNGIVEALNDSNAYLTKPSAPQELAARVEAILTDTPTALQKAAQAREDVVKQFSKEQYLAQFAQIYCQ